MRTNEGGPGPTRSPIGLDERREVGDEPWRSLVCCLEYQDPEHGWIPSGTGWLASPRKVVTAAHCLVYPDDHQRRGEPLPEVRVSPGRDGEKGFPHRPQTSNRFSVAAGYVPGGSVDDYALIHMPKPWKELKRFFLVRPVDSPSELIGRRVCVSGYPCDDRLRFWKQYSHTDVICRVEAGRIHYKTDTAEGESGAPVFLRDPGGAPDGGFQVIAIHTTSADESAPANDRSNSGHILTVQVVEVLSGWLSEPHHGNWWWA